MRNTTNTTAYSAVAGTTAYATDTVTFSKPTATSTAFSLDLTSAQLTNISAYPLQANTAYALILYAPTVNIGMTRTTGFASGTTNDEYTVTNGFTMLTTFRNNSKYSNNSSSFPSSSHQIWRRAINARHPSRPHSLDDAFSRLLCSFAS